MKNIELFQTWPLRDIVDVLKQEHPQTISVILNLMNSELASSVLSQLTERIRNDVSLRMLTIDSIDSKWIKLIDQGIGKSMKLFGEKTYFECKNSSEILTNLSVEKFAGILDNVREYDPELAQQFLDQCADRL